MTKYVPLHVHSQYSMMDGISKPHQIAQRCKEIGVPACALTDHGNVFGAVAHMKALKKHDIKPIIGCELYVCDQHASIKTAENRKLKHLVVLAKNIQGWRQLIKLISVANLPENLYYKPRLSIEQLAEFADGNLIAFSGHLGSHLSHTIFADMNAGTSCSCVEDVKQYTHTDWVKQTTDMAYKLRDIFGKGNFFIEVQLVDSERVPAMSLLAQGLRYVSKKTGIKTIATPDAHYCWKEDSFDQRIVLANSLNTTLKEVNDKLARGDDVGLKAFFESRQYYIPSYDDMIGFGNTEEELQATIDIADECETYDLSAKPRLPAFPCPDGISSKDYLQALLDKGWETRKPLIDKVISKGEYTEEDYKDRLKEEFGVLTTYKLEDYFLIVHDIVRYARQECKQVIGPGRGCLSPDTNIYLQNGEVKEIKDIDVGDKVICSDGNVNVVQNKFNYDCDEDLLDIYCYYGDNNGMRVTSDHKVLVAPTTRISNDPSKRQYDDSDISLQWIEAKNIKIGDRVFIPKIQRSNIVDSLSNIDLSIYSDGYRFTHDDTKCYHNVFSGPEHSLQRQVTYNRFIPQDEEWFFILGLFTGDGWICTHKDNWFGLAFNSKDECLIQKVEAYFNKYNICTTRRTSKTKNSVQLEVYNAHLVQHLSTVFNSYQRTSQTKHVPEIIFSLSEEYIQQYLSGYEMSDGHTSANEKRIKYTTTSKRLAYQVKFLYGILNMPCSIRQYDRSDKRGYPDWTEYSMSIPYENKTQYTYKILPDGILLRVRKIEKIAGVGKVYDIHVKDKHNYLTSSCIVHNSAAGSLILYLLGCVEVDPIDSSLLFSRFLNEGRFTKDHISLPDVDLDFEIEHRDEIVSYIRQKYGEDKVAQIVTFIRLQGRGILKDVIRAHGVLTFEQMNDITAFIPGEAEIAEQLAAAKESSEDGTASIVMWALENRKEELKQWAYIDNDGEIQGPLSKIFAQAIRLEGIVKSVGKHPAGVIIGPEPLSEVCPMMHDKGTNKPVCGFDMNTLEQMGMLKMDILGVAALSKIHGIINLLKL